MRHALEQTKSKRCATHCECILSINVGGIQGDRDLRKDCDVMRDDMLIVFIVF